MRGYICSHTDCYTFSSVYKEVWESCRENCRLFFSLIKVRHEINYVLIKVSKESFLAYLHKSGFCISHGSSAVTLDIAKVTMTVHKRQSFFEILTHYNKRLIDRAVTVRVIFTHGIADNTGTLSVWLIVSDAQLMHIIKDTSLNRLKTVPDIGEGTGHDYAHGIIDIRFLHYFGIFRFYNVFFVVAVFTHLKKRSVY